MGREEIRTQGTSVACTEEKVNANGRKERWKSTFRITSSCVRECVCLSVCRGHCVYIHIFVFHVTKKVLSLYVHSQYPFHWVRMSCRTVKWNERKTICTEHILLLFLCGHFTGMTTQSLVSLFHSVNNFCVIDCNRCTSVWLTRRLSPAKRNN